MLTCKIALSDSLHPIKIPDFGLFISLDGMNSVCLRLTNAFSFLAAGFCPQNLAFARK